MFYSTIPESIFFKKNLKTLHINAEYPSDLLYCIYPQLLEMPDNEIFSEIFENSPK